MQHCEGAVYNQVLTESLFNQQKKPFNFIGYVAPRKILADLFLFRHLNFIYTFHSKLHNIQILFEKNVANLNINLIRVVKVAMQYNMSRPHLQSHSIRAGLRS